MQSEKERKTHSFDRKKNKKKMNEMEHKMHSFKYIKNIYIRTLIIPVYKPFSPNLYLPLLALSCVQIKNFRVLLYIFAIFYEAFSYVSRFKLFAC
jgi:hypothetical protein